MNAIRKALLDFWSSFATEGTPVAAFPDGYAVDFSTGSPKPPAFPYITFALAKPDYLDFTFVTANVWDKNTATPGFFGRVDEVLGQISQKIPRGGVLLPCGGAGNIWLQRGTGDFISYMHDVHEGTTKVDYTIMRGVVRCVAGC